METGWLRTMPPECRRYPGMDSQNSGCLPILPRPNCSAKMARRSSSPAFLHFGAGSNTLQTHRGLPANAGPRRPSTHRILHPETTQTPRVVKNVSNEWWVHRSDYIQDRRGITIPEVRSFTPNFRLCLPATLLKLSK